MGVFASLIPDRESADVPGPVPIRSPRDLGVALRQARKAMHLTQSDLALAAGVGLRFIVELEAGKPTVRLELVLRVIDALGASLQLSGITAAADDGV